MPTTHYVWDEDNILYETDEDDNVTAEYLYDPAPDGHGRLISETRDGHTYTHQYDAEGNTIALTDETGNVTDTFTYNAWSEEIHRTGDTSTPFRWHGQIGYYWDEELFQHYVRARSYLPPVGRWTTQDPQQYMNPLTNPYVYCANNPEKYVDPSGLLPAGFVCPPDHPAWLPRPSYVPTTNGCSVPALVMRIRGWGTDQNRPTGGAFFGNCCDIHDFCYQDCPQTQAECDNAFAACLDRACRSADADPELRAPGFTLERCLGISRQYAGGVRLGGGNAFNTSQNDACCCYSTCDPSLPCVGPVSTMPVVV